MSKRSNNPNHFTNASLALAATVKGAILTPASTPSETSQPMSAAQSLDLSDIQNTAKMDKARDEKPSAEIQQSKSVEASSSSKSELKAKDGEAQGSKAKKVKCKKHSHHKKSKHRRKGKNVSCTETSSGESGLSDESDDDTASSSSSDSDSQEDKAARKERKRRLLRKKHKAKKRRSSHYESSSSDSETSASSSESDSSEDERKRRRHRGHKKARKPVEESEEEDSEEQDDEDEDEDDEEDQQESLRQRMKGLESQLQVLRYPHGRSGRVRGGRAPGGTRRLPRHHKQEQTDSSRDHRRSKKESVGPKKKRTEKRASTLEFKRVDQLWDNTIHDYKLTESADRQGDVFSQYVFTVRRTFDWENKYRNTVVDIKSKLLKEALAEVMKDVKGVSLVEEEPTVDPNMLFLYLDELRTYTKTTLKSRRKSVKKRKFKKRIASKIAHCKVLLSYIDKDYADTKKTLYPLLEAGNITFDLLWALFKPNTLAYTSTYGSAADPRCFKVDYANKESSFMRGEWYSIEGRYLEYDGKNFGLGDFEATVDAFKGPRKITGLPCYPLRYHRDPEGLKKLLIDRGKKFVALQGMNYRFHKGLAFVKKKKTVAKVNINGRVMVDPAIFRRVNPNYPISMIKPNDPDADDDSDSDASSDCCCGSSSESEGAEEPKPVADGDDGKVRMKTKFIIDRHEKVRVVQVEVDANGEEVQVENLDTLPDRQFTDEELLIASPVVLGFAFSEKLWLEFSLSGIREIEWNEGAFESLVLPENQKSIVKALVESHKFHAAKTIDDVVQGKGKGLVAVLHGPPGTGKTLTAEGIAELLKCPLYMVSAGELGTDPRTLEHELQKILDIAHSWGAVLLLDEADVFLEKREVHDIHRNALVSIFLRLLEYFQGILFLTTNRVETFDDAFQSRIHVALRYGELTIKAKKAVWKMFIEKVRNMEGGMGVQEFKDEDYEKLSKRQMNGRQIKNAVRTAQALAVNEKTKLTMEHIQKVLVVAESFDHDLKGGTGYLDAMRSYT